MPDPIPTDTHLTDVRACVVVSLPTAIRITRPQFGAWCDDYTEAQLDTAFAGREYLTPLDVMDLQESISTRLWALRRALPRDVRREICTRVAWLAVTPVAARVNDRVFSAALTALHGYLRDGGLDSGFGAAARGLRAYANRVWGGGTSVRAMAEALVSADVGFLWRTYAQTSRALEQARAPEARTFEDACERIVREVIVQRGL